MSDGEHFRARPIRGRLGRFLNLQPALLSAVVLMLCVFQSPVSGAPVVVTSSQFLSNGDFLLLLNGNPGTSYRILASTDLVNWDTVAYQVADASFGDFAYVDRTTLFFRARFYGAGLTNGDMIFPSLNISSPTNAVVSQPTVPLTGTASDASGIREVRLNDIPITGTTNFSGTLTLVPGTNRFLVSAIDASANRNRRSQFVQISYVPLLPAIITHPAHQTNDVATTATFSVNAAGSPPLGYRWRKNGADLSDGPHFSGTTTTSLIISNVGARDVAGYTVLVTNASGAVTSSIATLTISTPAGWIPVTNASHSENFDSLGDTGTNTPAGWFVGTGTGAVSGTNVTVSTGSSTGGNNYNFGSAGNSDRVLGSLASGSLQRDTEARFINASGSNLVSFALSYTGEQWRQGGTAAVNNDLVLQYSTTGTNFTALGNQFNFNSPFDTGPAGALDGNAATNRVTGIGGTYLPTVAVTNGGVFYLRWADADNTSNDHALGVDDLTITFTFESVP
ncbi:MAG: hypothetical protein EXS35_09005 [Pedosphaera sp.]|nr:hypothetical protein [Pedosphaera sp.]